MMMGKQEKLHRVRALFWSGRGASLPPRVLLVVCYEGRD